MRNWNKFEMFVSLTLSLSLPPSLLSHLFGIGQFGHLELRMSSTTSLTEHYIFDYFGPNIRQFDWVRLSWTTNATSQCHKRYDIAKPTRNLHILTTVVVKWNIASLGHFISNIHLQWAKLDLKMPFFSEIKEFGWNSS